MLARARLPLGSRLYPKPSTLSGTLQGRMAPDQPPKHPGWYRAAGTHQGTEVGCDARVWLAVLCAPVLDRPLAGLVGLAVHKTEVVFSVCLNRYCDTGEEDARPAVMQARRTKASAGAAATPLARLTLSVPPPPRDPANLAQQAAAAPPAAAQHTPGSARAAAQTLRNPEPR